MVYGPNFMVSWVLKVRVRALKEEVLGLNHMTSSLNRLPESGLHVLVLGPWAL